MNAPPTAAAQRPAMSPQAARHQAMCRELLRKYPRARTLIGPDNRSALAIPLLLALHWGLAWAVADTNIVFVFLAAFFFGQIILHAAGALLHDTAHRLVFRAKWPKLAFDIGLELILASFSKQLTYQHEHVSSHHRYMGMYDYDYEHEDVCTLHARRNYATRHPQLQRVFAGGILVLHLLPFGFLLSDFVVPWFYAQVTGRSAKDKLRKIPSTQPAKWERVLFICASIAVNAGLFVAFGFWGWLYHNWSLSIFLGACGVTNMGQSLSEHVGDDVEQPTRSHYGWINLLLFNTGYHNEHHALPSVAWSRLPALKALAPDMFTSVAPYGYLRHWWEHVRDDFHTIRRNEAITRDLTERCPLSDGTRNSA